MAHWGLISLSGYRCMRLHQVYRFIGACYKFFLCCRCAGIFLFYHLPTCLPFLIFPVSLHPMSYLHIFGFLTNCRSRNLCGFFGPRLFSPSFAAALGIHSCYHRRELRQALTRLPTAREGGKRRSFFEFLKFFWQFDQL